MSATSCDLHALLWVDDPARRATAAAQLESATRNATETAVELLAAYVASARPETGGIPDPILICRAANALADLAGLSAELGTAHVRLNAARDKAAAGEEVSP